MSAGEDPLERSEYDVRRELDWLASYPKSGNTWVRLLLAGYYGGTPYAVDFDMDVGRLFFGAVSPVPSEELSLEDQLVLRGAALFHLAADRRQRPMILKTHHVYGQFYGLRLFSLAWTRRVVYVVRDPRDVLPSFANHLGEDDLHEVAEVMDDRTSRLPGSGGEHYLSSWSDHVRSWTSDDNPCDVLVVRYEDLHEDAAGQLGRIVRHLGYGDEDEDPDPELLEAAAEYASFDDLREEEQERGFPEASSKGGDFFRKGEAGGWREEVPETIVARIESDHGEMMERMGYETELVGAGT